VIRRVVELSMINGRVPLQVKIPFSPRQLILLAS
jgi:hypothetical protein